MTYFIPSSRHPDTLLCVKNHAISELQWRTRDLLKLAEQSHSLGKIPLLTSALPLIQKTVQRSTSSQRLKDPSFVKVADIKLNEISSVDTEPQTLATTNPVLPQAEISPHTLSSAVHSPATASSVVNTSQAQPRALAKSFDSNSTASSSSWSWLGGGLLVAAAAGGGGSNPSNNKQLDNKALSADKSTLLQGLVMAGPLKSGHGLNVNIFDKQGQKLASQVPVDESGHFSVSLTNVTGTFVLIQVVPSPRYREIQVKSQISLRSAKA